MSRSLLIANDFPPVTSGIATFFSEIWRRLPVEGTEILAPLLPGSGLFDRTFPSAVHRIRLPLGERSSAKALKSAITSAWFLRRLLDHTCSRLHCGQVLSSGLLGLFCRRAFGVPYVVYVYGSETVRLGRGGRARDLMLSILEGAECVVTNSEATSREFAAFGVEAGRLRRVYPGVDPERFRPAPRDGELADRYGVRSCRVLLTVARLDQRKGHDVVIRAMAALPQDVVYLIAGRGREENQLRQLARDRGVESRVRFLGFVPDQDLPRLYNLCDVFVMPNRVTEGTALSGDIEGFGISFLEAGACGKPAVAGRSGGAVEAVVDGVTGRLVDPASPDEVAAVIHQLLADPSSALEMGSRARARIEREFDWSLLARQIETIL